MNTPTKYIGINADADADRPRAIDGGHHLPASRFDYGTVADEVAAELRAKANKILGLTVRATETIIAIGRELINAKDQIAHGDFECWTETEARISIRAAQQYMSVARFADQKNKSATIALFPPATAYRLVSKNVPPEIQLEVLERAESGDILPDSAIADMIQRANSEKQQARLPIIKAKRKEESKKWREQRRRELENHKAREERQQEVDRAKARSILEGLGIENVRSLLEALGDTSYYFRITRVLDYLAALASETAHDADDDDDAEEPPTVPEQPESSDITTLAWGGR